MSADTILTTVRQYLEFDPTQPVTLTPIAKGASGRTIVRVVTEEYEPFIGIYWTDERPDNDAYPKVAHFLEEKAGVNVASILHENLKWRVALVEDLGDDDLLSLKDRPWKNREPYYRSAFRQLDKLFFCRAARDMEFNPPFDASLYRWEQEYFFEHFVEGLLGGDADDLREAPEFTDLAERLGASAKHLVHRDFQSQNLMLWEDEVYWIDFQGMRKGRQEYDLASLIYDPYMDHSAEDRERLLDLWEDVSEDRPPEQVFRECAAQRLMQALGAFGNILRNRKDEWYRPHVPVAVKFLAEVTEGMPVGALLKPVLEKAAK
ncbi:phosphotransferase [Haloferula sargassicola]|uniref:Aminoglycoside phosphotransferase domain-containing protein n=1 Tax=Haloferula sargassicola TaxID=490096 RepID=A0ABP9UTD1_9BACT